MAVRKAAKRLYLIPVLSKALDILELLLRHFLSALTFGGMRSGHKDEGRREQRRGGNKQSGRCAVHDHRIYGL